MARGSADVIAVSALGGLLLSWVLLPSLWDHRRDSTGRGTRAVAIPAFVGRASALLGSHAIDDTGAY